MSLHFYHKTMEVIDYPNYIIYPDGRVFSKNRKRFIKPHLLINPKRPDNRYYNITLYKNGKKKCFRLHRLLFQHFKPDEWNSDLQIDHINRNSLDNRLENLRCVSQSVNCQNTGIYKTNTSRVKNISYSKQKKTWIYQKAINKKKNYKEFKTKEEAIKFKEEYEKFNNLLCLNYIEPKCLAN